MKDADVHDSSISCMIMLLPLLCSAIALSLCVDETLMWVCPFCENMESSTASSQLFGAKSLCLQLLLKLWKLFIFFSRQHFSRIPYTLSACLATRHATTLPIIHADTFCGACLLFVLSIYCTVSVLIFWEQGRHININRCNFSLLGVNFHVESPIN